MKNLNILCGFCGAGKTHYGKKWANNLSCPHFDLDAEICKKYGYENASHAVKHNGWEWFQEKEKEILKDILQINVTCIISLGGNTLNNDTLQMIKNTKHARMFWVDTPFEICWNRMTLHERPLAIKGKKECANIYEKRKEFYKQADITYRTQYELR